MIKTFLMRVFNYRFHVKYYLNPFIRFQINSLGDYSGITESKREVPIIVSLTSYSERFTELPLTIYSLLNQSLKPDRIILWLDQEMDDLTTLPYEITQFIKNGLEIRFVKDIKSYTKAIYTFKEYSDAIIVTADDDIFYPKEWLKRLYLSYIAHPEDIQVHRAHKVNLSCSYEKWEKHINKETAEYSNFLTGVGGVLYPPQCFSKEVLREDVFLKKAPTADDIWFWVMALVHKRKIRVVQNHYKTIFVTNIVNQVFKNNLYKQNRKGANDEQLKSLLAVYGQNVIPKVKE